MCQAQDFSAHVLKRVAVQFVVFFFSSSTFSTFSSADEDSDIFSYTQPQCRLRRQNRTVFNRSLPSRIVLIIPPGPQLPANIIIVNYFSPTRIFFFFMFPYDDCKRFNTRFARNLTTTVTVRTPHRTDVFDNFAFRHVNAN